VTISGKRYEIAVLQIRRSYEGDVKKNGAASPKRNATASSALIGEIREIDRCVEIVGEQATWAGNCLLYYQLGGSDNVSYVNVSHLHRHLTTDWQSPYGEDRDMYVAFDIVSSRVLLTSAELQTPFLQSRGDFISGRFSDREREDQYDRHAVLPTPISLGKFRVVGVNDGNSITVIDEANNQYRIRLYGIIAPVRGQDYSQRSKQHLASLVFGNRVDVLPFKQTKSGCIIGKVLLNEQDICLRQIQMGMAWDYSRHDTNQAFPESRLYAEAEQIAMLQERGLWRDKESRLPSSSLRDKADYSST
jgi:endonuclease YncB( thermonuclease family)